VNEPDCRELLERLQAFVDGEIDAVSCADIRTHLEACAPCLHHADVHRAFREVVARSCRESAPAGLLDRVRRLLD
jgi:mycothiol system anti-sigma-R factor